MESEDAGHCDDGGTDLTHEELVELTMKTLNNLVENDPVLSDLPNDVTVEEVSAQYALQLGKSMTVFVVKDNGENLPIVVHLGATVFDLKRALKRYMGLKLKRHGEKTKISWKHVWKKNWLVFGTQTLSDDNAPLSDFGIINKTKVQFKKRYREKNKSF